MRKICYITGTRADFGLMHNVLDGINKHPNLSLSLIVTGMHLLSKYGETWKSIKEAGFQIDAEIPVSLIGCSGAEMSIALGQQIIGCTQALQEIEPDIVMLLGDRGEMLAGALAALHLNIPIVHLHGGELSGTIDESIRHAISKIAHYHFTATNNSRKRLIKMGEDKDRIFVVGAPGLDAVYQEKIMNREKLFSRYKLNINTSLLLIVFHPVVQQADKASEQIKAVLDAALETDMQLLILKPNADAGSNIIAELIDGYAQVHNFQVKCHIPRGEFLSLIAYAEVMAGNSSSGIIEAASLNTPVVNIGDRQNRRERSLNVIDVEPEKKLIYQALKQAQKIKDKNWKNVYGNGSASKKIIKHLQEISLASNILEKVNAY